MNILLDGMGGDHAPDAVIEGAICSLSEMDENITIVGDRDVIGGSLKKYRYDGGRITVIHASQVIKNSEAPVKAVRTKSDSSIVRGLSMLKSGEADVFISAGSTGALMAGGMFILGRIQGIDRPTLATVYPVIGGRPSLLVDTGANTECKANNLLEFATMGSIYMEKVMGRKNPTVGLVNNGTEENKGTSLTKAAYELLEKSRLNFIGSVECRDLPDGVCDVIVTDGFTGNAILKLTEGMGLMVLREIKRRFLSDTRSRIGALLLRNKLAEIKKEFNYAEYGGSPFLGVKGAVLKMHGSSDALAVKKTILKSLPYVKEKVVETIQNSVLEIEEILISE